MIKDDICPICLEDNPPPVEMFDCLHVFHEKCIVPWINKSLSCPVCRRKINIQFPFIASEKYFYKNHIIIILNYDILTIFKNNKLLEIILYSKIKNLARNNTQIKITTSDNKIKKVYMSSLTESRFFFIQLKEKIERSNE